MKPAPTTMSQSNSTDRILSSVSLCAFVRSHGMDAGVSEFVDKSTGETFTKVVFPNAKFTEAAGLDSSGKPLAGRILTAGWGKSLPGGLTPDQVAARKEELCVIELNRPEHYLVCKQGELKTQKINTTW